MEGKNMNEIMKQDPSLENGKYVSAFERKCPTEMKIVELNILQMVGQDISETEDLHFKILVKGREFNTPRGSDMGLPKEEIASGTSFVQPFPESQHKLKEDAE